MFDNGMEYRSQSQSPKKRVQSRVNIPGTSQRSKPESQSPKKRVQSRVCVQLSSDEDGWTVSIP